MTPAPSVRAQQGFFEAEPNDTPAQSNPISAPVTVFGSMLPEDQDGFLLTITDNDARKFWDFELTGIPRALTIADVLRVECADNGIDVVAVESLMKMGTRDGVTPFIHRNQLLESGEYIVGIAHTGTHDAAAGGRNRAGGSHEAKPGFLVNLLPRTATNYERHRPENAGSEPPSASSRARNCG